MTGKMKKKNQERKGNKNKQNKKGNTISPLGPDTAVLATLQLTMKSLSDALVPISSGRRR